MFSLVMIFQKVASYPFSVSHDEPLSTRADYVLSDIDLNGNSKIGMAEVIYILTKNSGAEMRFKEGQGSGTENPLERI